MQEGNRKIYFSDILNFRFSTLEYHISFFYFGNIIPFFCDFNPTDIVFMLFLMEI